MAELQTIELFIKDDEDGVFALSLVKEPAMEDDFVLLSKETENENKFTFEGRVDKKRGVVVGFIMRPEKEIYRKVTDKKSKYYGKEFNIKFSAETVAKTAHGYQLSLSANNVTKEHAKPVSGCGLVETWVVEDPKNDKSNIWNLGATGGEWCGMMKLSAQEQQEAEDGIIKGYSIEGLFDGFEQLEMSEQLTEEQQLIESIKTILKQA